MAIVNDHTVKAFDNEISQLRGLIAEMGGLAEVAIRDSVLALVRHDEDLAHEVVGNDARLDALEAEVDRLAVRVADCGEANAFYSGEDRSITICSEEAAQVANEIAASSQQQLNGMNHVALAMDQIKAASIDNVGEARQLVQSAAQPAGLPPPAAGMTATTSILFTVSPASSSMGEYATASAAESGRTSRCTAGTTRLPKARRAACTTAAKSPFNRASAPGATSGQHARTRSSSS